MKAAVLGVPFQIRFSGATDFQYVEDTAAAFIACADRAPKGAHVFNLHGETVDVEKIATLINENAGRELVTFAGPPIPIAPAIDDTAIRKAIPDLPSTPLGTGIRETMRRFVSLQDAGRLDTTDIDAEISATRESTA
jgi:nucleoside-diphosphate-sugar epimerase